MRFHATPDNLTPADLLTRIYRVRLSYLTTNMTDGVRCQVAYYPRNAYSSTFGDLSEGLEEGSFTMQCMIPLDVGYDNEWDEAVSACSVPMD